MYMYVNGSELTSLWQKCYDQYILSDTYTIDSTPPLLSNITITVYKQVCKGMWCTHTWNTIAHCITMTQYYRLVYYTAIKIGKVLEAITASHLSNREACSQLQAMKGVYIGLCMGGDVSQTHVLWPGYGNVGSHHYKKYSGSNLMSFYLTEYIFGLIIWNQKLFSIYTSKNVESQVWITCLWVEGLEMRVWKLNVL